MLSIFHALIVIGFVAIPVIAILGFRGKEKVRENNFREPFEAPVTQRFCADCGSQINPRAEICPKCGVRQFTPESRERKRRDVPNRVTAALFAIFLGGLGIHKFYLGKVGQGIIYILFCWTFIPAIIGFSKVLSISP